MNTNPEIAPKADRPERRPYVAPELGRVDLEAEQVLGAGCKTTSSGGGRIGPNCVTGGCGTRPGS